MMTRLEQAVFTLSEASERRPELKKVLKEQGYSIKTIADLDPQVLYDQGIRVVVFDFDGVLAPQDDLHVLEPELKKLADFCQVFSQQNVIMWSNNPIPARMLALQAQFPDVEWLDDKPKPHPDAILQLIQVKACDPKVVMVIDDRLLTGILAGILAGTQVRLVTNPKIRKRGNFIVEVGFILLRKIEQFVFKF